MKKILTTIALAIGISALAFSAGATVFSTLENEYNHQYVTPNDGDACFTPEETADLRQKAENNKYEKVAFYDDANDVLKIKLGVIKLWPDTKLDEMTWVAIDAYSFKLEDGTEMIITTLYAKGADGKLCAFAGGPGPISDWNKIIEAAGLTPKATYLRPGFEPKQAN